MIPMIEPVSREILQTSMTEILVLITQVHSVKEMIVLRLIASIPDIETWSAIWRHG